VQRTPVGGAGIIVAALLLVGTGCSTSHDATLSPWCTSGKPQDFGVQRLHDLRGSLNGPNGPVSGARVRWRAVGYGMTSSREWQEGATDQNGTFFSTDKEPGEWELQVCDDGYQPIYGVVLIDQTSPIASFELFAERLNVR
jgi:hypothetical protein